MKDRVSSMVSQVVNMGMREYYGISVWERRPGLLPRVKRKPRVERPGTPRGGPSPGFLRRSISGSTGLHDISPAGREGYESKVDFFGEQTVQVLAATLQAAIVLLVAGLFVVLSARLSQSAAVRPASVTLACSGRSICPADDVSASLDGLHICLLTRAPPGSPEATPTTASPLPIGPGPCASTLDSTRNDDRLARSIV